MGKSMCLPLPQVCQIEVANKKVGQIFKTAILRLKPQGKPTYLFFEI